MDTSQPNRVDLLAVMLVDLRATVDAQKRSVVSAQAGAEEFKMSGNLRSLDDIADAIAQLNDLTRVMADGLDEAGKFLRTVTSDTAAGGSEASSV